MSVVLIKNDDDVSYPACVRLRYVSCLNKEWWWCKLPSEVQGR